MPDDSVSVLSRKVPRSNGHQIDYDVTVHCLDLIEKTLRLSEYNTQCQIVPTSWTIELKYGRLPDDDESSTVSIKLKRMDPSNYYGMFCVRASLQVSLYDAQGMPVQAPAIANEDRVGHGQELEAILNVRTSDISDQVLFQIVILVEQCHTETNR